jgi:serine/threonine protein kinase
MADLPSRFGPYEIISPLGAGGMGQVFRARDTRLQRFVAIESSTMQKRSTPSDSGASPRRPSPRARSIIRTS